MKKLLLTVLVVVPEVQVLEDVAAPSSLDPTETTGDDFQGMVESLQSSVDQLEEARGDLAEQDVDNVSGAYDSLKSSIQDLDDVPFRDYD